MKEKVVFKRYNLHLKGREYKVLVPAILPKKVYLTPSTAWNDSLLDGNHAMYKLLRSMSVEMLRCPELIVYVPSRGNGAINTDTWGNELTNYDVVFYCHNSQLNRHTWGKLKKMLPYVKAEQHTSVYSVSSYKDYCEKEVHTYKKSKDYYNKKVDGGYMSVRQLFSRKAAVLYTVKVFWRYVNIRRIAIWKKM